MCLGRTWRWQSRDGGGGPTDAEAGSRWIASLRPATAGAGETIELEGPRISVEPGGGGGLHAPFFDGKAHTRSCLVRVEEIRGM